MSEQIEIHVWNEIDRITVDYHRVTKIIPKGVPEGVSLDHVTWDYSEKLTIDRNTDTIEHIQKIGSGCSVSRKYEIEEGVGSLLDEFDADGLFMEIPSEPEDVIEDPNDSRTYKITIDYQNGLQRVIMGSYDKYGLPVDFADFAETMFDFIWYYGLGEILSPSVYGGARRRKSEYMFCSVEFKDGCQSYYYISDDASIQIGDFVVVPAGRDNHHAVAHVVEIEYFLEVDAPYPVAKTKHIIRKCTDDEFNASATIADEALDELTSE